MIEKLLTDLIDALNANTAALNGAGQTTATTAKADAVETGAEKVTKPGKTKKAEAKVDDTKAEPEHTQSEVNTALLKIKDDFSIEYAREILKKYKYGKMGDIKPEHFDVIFAEAEAKHAQLTLEADDDADDGL